MKLNNSKWTYGLWFRLYPVAALCLYIVHYSFGNHIYKIEIDSNILTCLNKQKYVSGKIGRTLPNKRKALL